VALTASAIERLRRIVNAPDVQQAMERTRAEVDKAVQRDRAGLPPISSGDALRDYVIECHVIRARTTEDR
jgi:hypothetical protein